MVLNSNHNGEQDQVVLVLELVGVWYMTHAHELPGKLP